MSLPLKLLVLVLAIAGLIGSGYRWGHSAAVDSYNAAQAAQAVAANRQLLRDFERGQAATTELGEARQAQAASYSTLERAFHDLRNRHLSLVARAAVPAVPAGGSDQGLAPGAPAAGPDAAQAAPGCVLVVPALGAAAEPELSAAAIWMWNSALAGTDRPAGACGLADTSEGACGAATGLSIQDAWANHSENARLCAEDRLAHNRLIDFLTQGKKP